MAAMRKRGRTRTVDPDHGSPIVEAPRTFILTWNPSYEEAFRNYETAIRITAGGRIWDEEWSCQSGHIRPRDRAFLLRQRRDRGLVGSGILTSSQYRGPHWSGEEGRTTMYGRVAWDLILDVEDRLPVESLVDAVPEVK
jgi:hypothetical protein